MARISQGRTTLPAPTARSTAASSGPVVRARTPSRAAAASWACRPAAAVAAWAAVPAPRRVRPWRVIRSRRKSTPSSIGHRRPGSGDLPAPEVQHRLAWRHDDERPPRGNHPSPAPRSSTCSVRWTGCARPSAGRPTTSTRPGCRSAIGASSLTLGGLLKHLAHVEDDTSPPSCSGEPRRRAVGRLDSDGSERTGSSPRPPTTPPSSSTRSGTAPSNGPARGSTAALADGGLDQLVHVSWPDGRHASLRRLVCDLIEEYGRHTGQADLLREAVDGLVGEDPPPGWRPRATG